MKSVLLAAILALAASAATAHEYKAGSLQIQHPWSRATPKGATVAGGYMKIVNTGSTPDRLIGGSTEAAPKFEIHEMSMDGGVMRMRAIEVLDLPANKAVLLRPGGHHMMLMDLKRPLKVGTKVAIELQLEKPSGERSAQRVELDVYNAPPPAR
jgi:copper(I)-binding protein